LALSTVDLLLSGAADGSIATAGLEKIRGQAKIASVKSDPVFWAGQASGVV
jgi:hypothetical protein